ncbi:hypothetical protein [Zooshikella ganghwensis]|uniref:Uncharacterized protein n=1 Tax=Zooshikella ganghwensis TaxID=202772 RepID=A0A4P9VG09_9GAMM|nr:hypothetical protein [Zooshikella ganghwensis]RDH41983.1 hypothetical protein B9G39_00160 [Zooshikella ganghwensis]
MENPAGKLHSFIIEAKKIKDSNIKVEDALSKLWNEKSYPRIYTKFAKMMQIPEEIEQSINDYIPEQEQFCRRTVSGLKNAFSKVRLHTNWNSFVTDLNVHIEDKLGSISSQIEPKLCSNEITDNTLEELKQEVDNLINSINTAEDLEDDFKNKLVNYLQKILSCIDDYSVTGSAPIFDSVAEVVGYTCLDESFGKNMKDEKKGIKELFKKVTETFSTANTYIGLPLMSG